MLKRVPKLQPKWRATWEYVSPTSGKTYRVSVDYHDNWACSCRGWCTHRNCHHIKEAKVEYALDLVEVPYGVWEETM